MQANMKTIQNLEYVGTTEEDTVVWVNNANSNTQVCAKRHMTTDTTITWVVREVMNATNLTQRCAVIFKDHDTAQGEGNAYTIIQGLSEGQKTK